MSIGSGRFSTSWIEGKGGDHEGVEGKVRFTALVNPMLEGGTLESSDEGLRIRGADSVTLYTSIATNFVRFDDVSADSAARAEQHLAEGLGSPYDELRAAHIAAYRDQFDRVSLELGSVPAEPPATDPLPTGQRLANFRQQNDWLVLVPSNSPENDYLHRDDGVQAAIDAGVTMDNQLVFDLFSLVMEASEILNQDLKFAAELESPA